MLDPFYVLEFGKLFVARYAGSAEARFRNLRKVGRRMFPLH